MCTTASNRLVRGKTFSLTPADCERDLYIRAKDACGTAESFLVIPCQVTNYYYDVNVALGEVAIGVVKTDNAEVNAILTAQKAKQAVVFNAATDVKIKSVVVYTENRQVLYSKEYAMGVSEIKIDAGVIGRTHGSAPTVKYYRKSSKAGRSITDERRLKRQYGMSIHYRKPH